MWCTVRTVVEREIVFVDSMEDSMDLPLIVLTIITIQVLSQVVGIPRYLRFSTVVQNF